MISSGYNFNLASPSGGSYVLPDSPLTVVHVNANDLANGTARVGPSWTENGSVTFNNAGVTNPSSVGPFSTSNYYSQTNSPAAFSAIPFTTAVVFSGSATAAYQSLFGCAYNATVSYLSLMSPSSNSPAFAGNFNNGAIDIITANVPGSGVNLLLAGFDGAGAMYMQLNGGALVTSVPGQTYTGPSPATVVIGVNITSGTPTLAATACYIYEITASTDVPSSGAFTAIYNSFVAAYASPNRYLIPETANVVTHVNANDLNSGTAKHGGAWTKQGTVPYNILDFPNPSVGVTTDSNFYTQTLTSPANLAAAPFTIAMLVDFAVITASNIPLSAGLYGASGYYLQVGTGNNEFVFAVGSGAGEVVVTASPDATAGGTTILLCGMDITGEMFAQINGGTVGTRTGGAITQGGVDVYLGTYGPGGQSGDCNIYEVMISTDIPSSAAFNALYAKIVANGGQP